MNPKSGAKRLAAAAIRSGCVPDRPGINRITVAEGHGRNKRPLFALFLVRGQTYIKEMKHATKDIDGLLKGFFMCRYCGCTECYAYPGGCSWMTEKRKRIHENVCSHPLCVKRHKADLAAKKRKRRKAKAKK